METTLVLAVWAAIFAAPGLLGLMIGEWIGARRAHRLYALSSPSAGEGDTAEAQAMVVQPWRLEGRIAPRVSKREETASTAEQRFHRRRAFAAMPPLEVLRAEADAIRKVENQATPSVWEDPGLGDKRLADDAISARVLQHYEASVRQLSMLNRDQSDRSKAEPATGFAAEMPRIAAAAPLELSIRGAELARDRLEQARPDETAEQKNGGTDQPSALSSFTLV